MISHSLWFSVFLLTLCVDLIAATESNETLRETPLKRCAEVNKKAHPRFHLIRRCARSDVRVIIAANFSSPGRCSEFTVFKQGLAFNFGWLKDGVGHCEVLECPEHDTLSFLRRRENYDYYSLYAAPMPSMDWMCVPKLGMYRIGRAEARSASSRKCQEWALMQSPRNKTESEKESDTGSSTPGVHGLATSVATTRTDDRSTMVAQPTPMSVPSPTLPPPTQPVIPFPPSPPFEGNPMGEDGDPFGPPFLPPDFFPGNLEGAAFENPEYKLEELLDTSNATDSKPRIAGQLANALSQERTTNLTMFLKSKIGKFFSPVLVGLATVPDDETLFATADAEPLPCFRFRAWAPGQPLTRKHLNAILKQHSSTKKPPTQVKNSATANTTSTTGIGTTNSSQPPTNETINNNGTINITTSAAERKRDEITLCVYIHRDSLWHTNICSSRTSFLCEFIPSGGPCRDTNSTDDRAECEYQKVGTKEERCSAWNGEMITTMTPIEPDQEGGDKDDTGNSNDGNSGADENNNDSDDDNHNNGDDNNDNDENNRDKDEDNNDKDEQDNNTDEQNNNTGDQGDIGDNEEKPENEADNNGGNEDDTGDSYDDYENNGQEDEPNNENNVRDIRSR